MQAHCGPIKRMARGGMIQGPGTGTSDSIPAEFPVGTFIQPADTTRKIMASDGESALPPEQLAQLGAILLEAIRNMTHKPAGGNAGKGPFSTAAAGFSNGGRMGYADGGVVPAPTPSPLPALLPDTRAVMAGSGADASAAINAGNIPAAAGHIARGTIALPLAIANDVIGAVPRQATANVASIAGRSVINAGATALTGSNAPVVGGGSGTNATATPVAAPVAVAPAPVAATRGPFSAAADSQAAGGAGAPVPTINGNTGATVAGAPGVFKFGGYGGQQPLYTNVSGEQNLPGGQPSAQNNAAADALAARYATPGPIATAAAGGADPAPGTLSAGPGMRVVGGSSFFRQGQPLPPTTPSGISAREAARLENSRVITAENNATSRENNAASTGVTREGQQLHATQQAAQLALDKQKLAAGQPLTQAQTQHQQAQAAQAGAQATMSIASIAARQQYANALATGDAKAIAAAERQIRVIDGKEREARYLAVPGGQETDPVTLQNRTVPSAVFNQDTGQFVQPPQRGAGSPQTRPVGTISTVGGKSAKWDGQKWVPQ